MHTVDLTRRIDDEIITIITTAIRTGENWEPARKNLGLRKPIFEVPKKTQNMSQSMKKLDLISLETSSISVKEDGIISLQENSNQDISAI
jgi:hypothetical protein